MNLRKIIKEEMDDFGWIRDINPTLKLEPNTVYYFRPMLTVEEYPLLAKFIDSDEVKLKLDERAKLTHMMNGIHYIVYDFETGDNIRFWENELHEDPTENSERSMEDSKGFYPDYNFIDFRKHYKFFNNINESEEDDWDWAINSQPLELQDPKEWIGKSFGYGQSIIDGMYDYEIERGDDKETFEIVGVEDDGLLIARVHPSFGRVGFATKVYIRAFIERMNKGVWIWA